MIVLNYTELNKLHGVMRSKKKRKEKEHFEQKNGNARQVKRGRVNQFLDRLICDGQLLFNT
jgi:hypothetical protein